ncbi:hypothetical protein V8B55DRAFT_1554927 [Mucor lusitanicus]
MSSVGDINRKKLDALCKKLAASHESSFEANLKAVFDVHGQRQAVDPTWLKQDEPVPLAPIIVSNAALKPIMTQRSKAVNPESTQDAQQHDPMEEDVPELEPLIGSMSVFSGSSSQIQTQVQVELLSNLIELPLAQLKIVIPAIDMQSWSDDIIASLLKEITKANTIPSTNASYLVHAATFAKVAALKSNVTRVLMNSIQQLAQHEGKCIMDGLLVPLLFQSELGKAQCEVINKSISELNPSQRVSMLQTIISDGESYFAANTTLHFVSRDHRNYLRPWNDAVIQIISTLLSTQPLIELDKTLLGDLIQPLKIIVQGNPKDKGAMQLLLLLTSKYAQAIIEHQAIDSIEEICQTSTMFLKRAVLGQIASMRKRMAAATAASTD